MDGLHPPLAHQRRPGNGTVKPGVMDHLNDSVDSSSLFADQAGPRAGKLHLAGCVGAVSHLLLQTLDMKMVALARGSPSGQEKTRESLGHLRQNQKSVAHRRGAKPFVSVNQVFPRSADRLG